MKEKTTDEMVKEMYGTYKLLSWIIPLAIFGTAIITLLLNNNLITP